VSENGVSIYRMSEMSIGYFIDTHYGICGECQ